MAKAETRRLEIEVRAYSIWEREGRPEGRALSHWLEAEAQMRKSAKRRSSTSKPKEGAGS